MTTGLLERIAEISSRSRLAWENRADGARNDQLLLLLREIGTLIITRAISAGSPRKRVVTMISAIRSRTTRRSVRRAPQPAENRKLDARRYARRPAVPKDHGNDMRWVLSLKM